ncbi:MAG TPA: sulfatase [Thermoanaerobaculia bacterium]|jgi:arylsulfatase A-like enzyme|nr:sulfatase [Thermoanaerobaculia bacterium]
MTPFRPPVLSRRAALTLAVSGLLAGLAAGCRHEPPKIEPLPAKSNILLITVDTLRADHLSAWGYERPTSPTIDRLAAEGVRFDQASVQWPKTTPSFASMFTSTYAKDNGMVRKVGVPLSCKFTTLAENLQRQGYATAAVVANGALGSEFHFDQGFDVYIETWKLDHGGAADPTKDPNGAEAVTKLAEGLLAQLDKASKGGKPWFLWVHYLDPHAPYTPPGEYAGKFQGDAHFDPSSKIDVVAKPNQQMMGIGQKQVLEGHTDLAFYRARYDAEISYNDAQIGRLLGEMKRRQMLGKTLTVFTADHGESLGEHAYYFDHGRFSFQTCLRVPLIVHYPGVLAPRVDHNPVELIDLAPTLLEAAGGSVPATVPLQGHSLTPRLRGIELPVPAASKEGDPWLRPPGTAFSESGWETDNKWQKVVRDRRFKLILAQTRPEQRWIGGEGIRFTLYDLQNDPGETQNVADKYPDDLERLKKELWAWDRAPHLNAETDTQIPATCAETAGREMDDETRKLLESLGYL